MKEEMATIGDVSQILRAELLGHYRHKITESASDYIKTKPYSELLNAIAFEIAALNSEFVLNHKDSDNENTQENIRSIFETGFSKRQKTMLFAIHMEMKSLCR